MYNAPTSEEADSEASVNKPSLGSNHGLKSTSIPEITKSDLAPHGGESADLCPPVSLQNTLDLLCTAPSRPAAALLRQKKASVRTGNLQHCETVIIVSASQTDPLSHVHRHSEIITNNHSSSISGSLHLSITFES